MEEEVLVGTRKGSICGRCFSYFVHDNWESKLLHPVEVHTHIRMQMAQHCTVDVHAIVPGGGIRFVVGMDICATRKHDECHYQKEWKERPLFH